MKVSVITINLNDRIGLFKTIKSVINQSFSDFEFILIDGGSNDGSRELMLEYENYFSYWISEPDNGIYQAMNKGILKAKGEYCFFLNSGDYFVDGNVLEKIFTKAPEADILYGNLLVVSEDNIIVSIKGKEKLTFLDVYSSKIKHQASFIRRRLFEQYGLFDESLIIAADWAFFIKTLGLSDVSYVYRDVNVAFFDNNGISNRCPEICRNEEEKILNHFVPKKMQEDYRLLKKFNGIREINDSRIYYFIFRILVKISRFLRCN